ncbi:hypothetical protein VTO42DRAFT_4267 [Malbranchea cinnamomea]
MKLIQPLTAASVAAAIVLPDQKTLLPAVESNDYSPEDLELRVSALGNSQFFNNIEWTIGEYTDKVELAKAVTSEDDVDVFQFDAPAVDQDSIEAESLELGQGHHDKPHHTIYEKIKMNRHSVIFSKLVDEFDDIVKKLNDSSSTYTVFVPRDASFKRLRHHPSLPKEYLKAFVEYHISPERYTAQRVFSSRTIPTSLKEDALGYHQRISTQFGLRGLTLNYISHIIKANIKAKNGVIHALDHFLIPPFLTTDTLGFVPSVFSTFELGLWKTGLFDRINKTSTHTGGTFFVPTNTAFKKLGPCANAFLFSRWGEKYLKALLKYHIVFNRTLYSDAFNKPKKDEAFVDGTIHVDLPTLLEDHHLSIDIAHYHRFYAIKINGFTTVAAADVCTKDGVIQILHDVLIPPRKPHFEPRGALLDDLEDSLLGYSCSGKKGNAGLSVRELMARLDPYVED